MSDKKTVSDAVRLDRLRELIDGKRCSRQEIASDPIMDCDVSLITKHYNGDRPITMEFLIKYCKYFNVSADYLLGQTGQPTLNPKMKEICEYTGMSEEAVQNMKQLNGNRFYSAMIEYLLSDKKIIGLLAHYYYSGSIRGELSKSEWNVVPLKKTEMTDLYKIAYCTLLEELPKNRNDFISHLKNNQKLLDSLLLEYLSKQADYETIERVLGLENEPNIEEYDDSPEYFDSIIEGYEAELAAQANAEREYENYKDTLERFLYMILQRKGSDE